MAERTSQLVIQEIEVLPLDLAAISAQAARLRLITDPRRRLMGGAWLSRAAGVSQEFHDHRNYVPGDDTRHLDWAVYARSDQLVLRRQRQEVRPGVEILLDSSASMNAHPDKWLLARSTAALLAMLCEAAGAKPRLWWADTSWHQAPSGVWRQVLGTLPAQSAAGLAAQPAPQLGNEAERILISDALWPEDPAKLLSRLGRGAASMCTVCIRTQAELAPSVLGPVLLEDVEGGQAELVLDEDACKLYQQRLERLDAACLQALAGRGAGFISVSAEEGLAGLSQSLLSSRLLETARG
jgi:uncharacterized protein (DUF58 family)